MWGLNPSWVTNKSLKWFESTFSHQFLAGELMIARGSTPVTHSIMCGLESHHWHHKIKVQILPTQLDYLLD